VPRGVILSTSFRNSLLATTSHNGKVAVSGATSGVATNKGKNELDTKSGTAIRLVSQC